MQTLSYLSDRRCLVLEYSQLASSNYSSIPTRKIHLQNNLSYNFFFLTRKAQGNFLHRLFDTVLGLQSSNVECLLLTALASYTGPIFYPLHYIVLLSINNDLQFISNLSV